MNPTTFNDRFMPLLTAAKYPAAKQRAMLNAPLFVHADGKEDWQTGEENAYARDAHGLVILPFPYVRLALSSWDGCGRTQTKAHIIVEKSVAPGQRDDGALIMHAAITEVRFDGKDIFKSAAAQSPKLYIIMRLRERIPGTVNHQVFLTIYDVQKKTIIDPTAMNQRVMQGAQDLFYELLQKFCIDVMNPANHIAAVRPPTEGKSIEWQNARTHYIILPRNHKANVAGLEAGSVVPADDEKRMLRIAHSRRAHYRLLRSLKFKNKVGQRIFIRSTWVGPEEWKDECGSIYKIIHPTPRP